MTSLITLIHRYLKHEGFIFPPFKITSAHSIRQLSSLIMLITLLNSLLSPLAQASEMANGRMSGETRHLATSPIRNLAHSLLNNIPPYYPPKLPQAKSIQPAPLVQPDELTTYTDAQGYYIFRNMDKGTHKITLDLPTLPATMPLLANEKSPILWLNPGQTLTAPALSNQVSFTAFYDAATATISGHVFVDSNGNGQFDTGEPGVPNVKVIDPTVHQYFVPFNDNNLITMFQGKVGGTCYFAVDTVNTTLESFIYLTAASDDTIYYYDHWEDGYDTDSLNPTATSSTEIGVLGAGTTKLFQSEIIPGNIGSLVAGKYYYDGRDRITIVGTGATVIRQAYPKDGTDASGSFDGVIAAAAWEVPEVANWGTSYVATVGENLDFNAGLLDDHDFTGLSVTAAKDNTPIYYKGALVSTINTGQTYFVNGANNGTGNGGVDSNDTITSTQPIEVHLLSGGCGTSDGYGVSANGYELEPQNAWTNEYFVPVPGFSSTCVQTVGNNPDTDIYLHNPSGSQITVNVITSSTTIPITIPANSTISLLQRLGSDISTGNQGVKLTSSNIFWGVSTIDSTTLQTSTNGIDYDWGYSLVPIDNLSSQVVLGYSPGNGAPFPTDNGNLAFVMPVTNSIIRVDLDQNGTTDKMDLNGDGDVLDTNVFGWDETTSNNGVFVLAGQVLRIGSYASRNMQGAIIYTNDVEKKIAVAWGQDACRASEGSPYLDNGNTVLPSALPIVNKEDTLEIDADGSGTVTPGDRLRYTISIFNNSILGDLNNPLLTDTLPFTYTDFRIGSVTISSNGTLSDTQYSTDGVNFVSTPAATNSQKIRFFLGDIGPLTTITVSFEVIIRNDVPMTITEISNSAEVGADNVKPVKSQDPDDPTDPDTDTPIGRPQLILTKSANPTIIAPNGRFTYTIVISNSGNGPANSLVLSDIIPAGLNYVSNTMQITYPVAIVSPTVREL